MDVNLVILAGRLTRDVTLSFTTTQVEVAEFGVAVNKIWMSKGEKKEKVMFIDCVCFGKTAININKFFHKGKSIYLQGELDLNTWEKDGVRHSKHKINVLHFQFIDKAEKKQDEPPQDTPF